MQPCVPPIVGQCCEDALKTKSTGQHRLLIRFTEANLGYADPHMEKYYTKHNNFKCVIRLYSLLVYCYLVLNI